jgi:hypothetical protein
MPSDTSRESPAGNPPMGLSHVANVGINSDALVGILGILSAGQHSTFRRAFTGRDRSPTTHLRGGSGPQPVQSPTHTHADQEVQTWPT